MITCNKETKQINSTTSLHVGKNCIYLMTMVTVFYPPPLRPSPTTYHIGKNFSVAKFIG